MAKPTKMDLASRERNTRPVMRIMEERAGYQTAGAEPILANQIRADGGTQMRAGLNPETVVEYAEWLLELVKASRLLDMPPVEVYYDGTDYWLADGFHRLAAWRMLPGKVPAIHAIVRAGDRRNAILHAASANSDHGLRRTNADKRRAVETLLRDEEWQQWSNRAIATACAVSLDLVNRIRDELSERFVQMPTERKVTRKGKTYTQETANIGRKAQAPAPSPPSKQESEEELIEEEQAAIAEVMAERESEEQERLKLELEPKPVNKHVHWLARAIALRSALLEIEAQESDYFLEELKLMRDPLKRLINKLERRMR